MLWQRKIRKLVSRRGDKNETRGFALIVTISLMVLLTIIAVGLLSLSAIELRTSSGSKARAIAQSNARMALLIALGELQRQAGPDQRITATADIAAGKDGYPLQVGEQPKNDQSPDGTRKGLSSLQPGTRYWTGIFVNTQTNPALSYKRTPGARLLQWLVSGNDYLKEAARINPDSSMVALNADGKVADSSRAVVVVGSNTVGSPQSGGLDDFVSVPLVDVVKSDTEHAVTGRFGWWVGDEGVKARLDPAPGSTDKEITEYASLVSPRRGWEVVKGFEDYPPLNGRGSSMLTRIPTLASAQLALPSLGKAINGRKPLQSAFHSATTSSFGVIADTLHGGLRLDLSNILADKLPAKAPVEVDNYPLANANVIPKTVAPRIQGPKWDAIQEAFQPNTELENGKLVVREAKVYRRKMVSPPIAPLICDFRVLLGAKLVPSTQGSQRPGTGNNYYIYPVAKFAVALANPYPYPLEWSGDLEFYFRDDTPSGNKPSCIWRAKGQPAYLPGQQNREAVLNNTFFRVPPATLEPGEAKAWTIGSQVFRRKGSGTRRTVVKLVPFGRSDPANLENSVVLEDKNVNTISGEIRLDVRESWTTSQPSLVMRMPNARRYDPPLREVSNLEWDNGYFSPNTRRISSSVARRMTKAFPLMLYSYHFCRPGTDYLRQYLPRGSKLGLRGSTLRTFMDFNLEAAWFIKPIACYTPPPYFMESNDSISQLPFRGRGGETGSAFTRNLAIEPVPWGHSVSGSRRTVIFAPPRDFASIAEFQHLDLTADDQHISVGHQPGNAVGNSYASPFLKRANSIESRKNYQIQGVRKGTPPKTVRYNYYDIAYLLNTALWDTYYFSTLSTYGEGMPKNRNIVLYHTQPGGKGLDDGVEAAAHLLIHGAQNVNSTSKDAWKALLASTRHMKLHSGGGDDTEAMFPRSLEQPAPAKLEPTGKDEDSFAGYRRLTDDQIDALAEEITRQVRQRGPFVSLSHFINRTLVALEKDRELGRCGPLQAAIDQAGINISPDARKNAFTRVNTRKDKVSLQYNGQYPRADLDGTDPTFFPNPDKVYAPESRDNNPGTAASILADRNMLLRSTYRPEQGFRTTGIPGWLTQADVLQAIGPLLSVRSDTFRIRAYGEALDTNGKTIARAWCEAIVQRTPEYIDPANKASDRGSQLTKRNATFGRRFQLVSFRWLSPDEV